MPAMPSRARSGLTLIELLVVIGLLAVLATLTAFYIAPAFADNKNIIRGLDRLTTTLLIAKQRALRDQDLRGVRLLADSNGQVRELQFIEQPGVYRQGAITSINPQTGIGQKVVTFTGVDFIGGAAAGKVEDYNVGPGDYFRRSSPTPAVTVRIESVLSATELQLPAHTPALLGVLPPASGWSIYRKPRPIPGEDTVLLPDNVIIDLRLVVTHGPNNQVVPNTVGSTSYYDILFDPAGGVLNASSRTLVLWVRDATTQDPLNERDRSRLLSIHPRTGLLSAHELGPTTNPLQFATDGRSSGL